MEILENSGLHEEILSKGTVVEGIDFNFNQRPVGSVSMSLVEQTNIRYPFPFVLPQPEVEAAFDHVLNKRGYQVEWECEAAGLELMKDYVEVKLKNGETIEARYVVGCDGAHSFVRHSQSYWKFEGRPVNLLWAQCDGTVKDPRAAPARGAGFIGATGFHLCRTPS
jgi:2-polyprenyl-6-methoxyphenol hydroxylase-like FAD-dependent oxidoreductase